MSPALIVGDRRDPHALAVATRLRNGAVTAVLVDAESLRAGRWRLADGTLVVDAGGVCVAPRRGWLRRLAPPQAHEGIDLGSRDAAELGARLSLLTSLADTRIEWLTGYWELARAESKLSQYSVAIATGIPVPRTEVVSHIGELGADVGDPFILKPLGPGDFNFDGGHYAVHAHLTGREDCRLEGLGEAPFLCQAYIDAACHLRVVTVLDRSWCHRLDARGLPVDWRADAAAHRAWTIARNPDVEHLALALADALHLGYSSQDWIVDHNGDAWFVDGNPGGQWLFLPEPSASEITEAIAGWLIASGIDR